MRPAILQSQTEGYLSGKCECGWVLAWPHTLIPLCRVRSNRNVVRTSHRAVQHLIEQEAIRVDVVRTALPPLVGCLALMEHCIVRRWQVPQRPATGQAAIFQRLIGHARVKLIENRVKDAGEAKVGHLHA
eukprot:5401947-Prymnesium_polylepis.2